MCPEDVCALVFEELPQYTGVLCGVSPQATGSNMAWNSLVWTQREHGSSGYMQERGLSPACPPLTMGTSGHLASTDLSRKRVKNRRRTITVTWLDSGCSCADLHTLQVSPWATDPSPPGESVSSVGCRPCRAARVGKARSSGQWLPTSSSNPIKERLGPPPAILEPRVHLYSPPVCLSEGLEPQL